MLDLLLMTSLGFLGSFGHCAGMCGPLTAAFSLSQPLGSAEQKPLSSAQEQLPPRPAPTWHSQFQFHLLLNLGRILSYVLIGASIGAIGSVLVAGGQIAGVGSLLRRLIAILTGLLLIGFGLSQINPEAWPRIPFLHPLAKGNWHQRLSTAMVNLSLQKRWWTPLGLGAVWGLIPCGFLYAAQIKAAETGNLWLGGATMLAFGLGTLPMMLGVGLSTSLVSADRRSQLFRLGGWITLTIGVLTLLRTGDTQVDYTGHAALLCLGLALVARPLSRIWVSPLRYRRVLGVGAFVFSVAHTLHMVEHSWGWNLEAVWFMLTQHQIAIALGFVALLFMAPAAFTSFDWAQRRLGKLWRSLHLLSVPALILAMGHTALLGSHYLGAMQLTEANFLWTGLLGIITLGILLIRIRGVWSILLLEKFYVPPNQPK